jgi:hypothetical protein
LNADPDPDPTAQINADPCGSGSDPCGSGYGSETLEKSPKRSYCSKNVFVIKI